MPQPATRLAGDPAAAESLRSIPQSRGAVAIGSPRGPRPPRVARSGDVRMRDSTTPRPACAAAPPLARPIFSSQRGSRQRHVRPARTRGRRRRQEKASHMGRGAGLARQRGRTWAKKAGDPGAVTPIVSRRCCGVVVAAARVAVARHLSSSLPPLAPRGSASLSQSQYNPGASCTSPMNAQWFGASEEDGRSLLHRLAQQAGQ
jgi:hypothetical protein